jgi:hypothetical protein
VVFDGEFPQGRALMAEDDKEKRVLRDTTKPEHRPSWGMSRDNAPKGAASINWGDRGVPVPTPGGTGSRAKTGIFARKPETPAPAPKEKTPAPQPQKLTGLFSRQARETRADQALMGGSKKRADSPEPGKSTRATITLDQADKKPVFRRNRGRDEDSGRGR